ncbi:Fe-S cluster assembly ATPase SufC [Truepera radiovictrix]|uniref:FeS assembly ATPase SufC n=1 Tax=Truepera radiovictrix (strain DSM 17093 / CIP 108686 / LMG 22925 / RQ-24) TaxID=649638 RepID=D7CR05_TRURR|nr:Fe-S cluster assembly ATPase SufC [Truepera radiovictrix]ADI13405.1 FeS assembly ATPase SufC [Truepera radiovictrix DSM 17093]WMT58032.1 Fe-S cluster assembly ATPase SufC [Truepera radiovictrix]
MNALEIRNLHASIGGEPILRGVNLIVPRGEVHALMGPNGSGKSTLSKVIAGDPTYEVTEGDVLVDGESILELEPDERARKGLYLAFQYPVEVPGVSMANFLRLALNARRAEGDEVGVMEFYNKVQRAVKELNWDENILERYLNEGFSGGEKKRSEVLQMLVLEPKYALLDETDSGLDVDALKVVSQGVNAARGPEFGALVITHYQRLLNYIVPDKVHVMYKGQIIREGPKELAVELDQRGYDWIREEVAA